MLNRGRRPLQATGYPARNASVPRLTGGSCSATCWRLQLRPLLVPLMHVSGTLAESPQGYRPKSHTPWPWPSWRAHWPRTARYPAKACFRRYGAGRSRLLKSPAPGGGAPVIQGRQWRHILNDVGLTGRNPGIASSTPKSLSKITLGIGNSLQLSRPCPCRMCLA